VKKLVLIWLLLFPHLVNATDYYVDGESIGGTCHDYNSGTSLSSPFCTIDEGVDHAYAGDTVYVRAHTYTEYVTATHNGSSGNEITIKNYGSESPIINGSGNGNNWGIQITGDYIIWDGISIRDNPAGGIDLRGDHGLVKNLYVEDCGNSYRDTGFRIYTGDYNTVQNVEVYGSGWNGINVVAANYTVIEYCSSHDNDHHMGINLFPVEPSTALEHGNVVRYCLLYDNAGSGIYMRYQDGFEYYGNVIYGNNSGGIKLTYEADLGTGSGISYYNGNGVIYNNTVVNNGDDGIKNQSSRYTDIYNNIVSNNDEHEIYIYSVAQTGADLDYNLLYDSSSFSCQWGGTTSTSLSSWQSTTSMEANSIRDNPDFTNPNGHNYTITSVSPARDTGYNLGSSYDDGLDPGSTWPDDVSLLDRDNQGDGWDIGAYEYVSDSPPPIVYNNEFNHTIGAEINYTNNSILN
jgi:parallel beta-helix repeat protein